MGACRASCRHSSMTSRSTGLSKSRRLRTARVVDSTSSAERFNCIPTVLHDVRGWSPWSRIDPRRLSSASTTPTGTAACRTTSRATTSHEFTDDPQHISRVVQFDLPRLGDIAGLRGVHLQCHIGTDTVSLARLGAHDDRARLLRRRRWRWPRGWRRDCGQQIDLRGERRVRRGRRARRRASSTSCSPASARCAGCPTSLAGRRWSRRC